jgi:hypothetical protein
MLDKIVRRQRATWGGLLPWSWSIFSCARSSVSCTTSEALIFPLRLR